MPRVFVYGTLMRGQPAHSRLAAQRLLGGAVTAPGYRLYSLGEYPGMVEVPGGDGRVWGELWEVDAATLAALDRFEGLPQGLYTRALVKLEGPWSAADAEAYFYARSTAGCADLGGHWPPTGAAPPS